MEHFKKRLIHQVEDSILRETHQSVMDLLATVNQSSTRRPRGGQRGRKRKTAQVPILKLGTGDPTALCKSKETYTASAENVHRQYENVTVTGNAKKHKVSEDASPGPGGSAGPSGPGSAGRHVLPAIVPGMPEIFGTSRRGRGRGRGGGRPNLRYQRKNAPNTSRSMDIERPRLPVPEEPVQVPHFGFLYYPDLERDILRIQNPMYPSDVEMINAIEALSRSIVRRDVLSVENLISLNKFYLDLRQYHGSEKIIDNRVKEKVNMQMNELVDYATMKLIGYLDRYSVRYMREMLLLDLTPHQEFFTKHAEDIKQRGKNHIWLRTLVQKLSKPDKFELPDDPVRLVDLKTLQSNGAEEPDKTAPDGPAVAGAGTTQTETVEDQSPFPGYFLWENTKIPMPFITPSVTITPIPSTPKQKDAADAPSTITSEQPAGEQPVEEPMEEPTDLSVRSTENSTLQNTEESELPVKEEKEEENSAVQYYAQELRKFKKLVKDTNEMVYNEVLKQYRDDDVYVVEDESDERGEDIEEAEQNHSTGTEEAEQNHNTSTGDAEQNLCSNTSPQQEVLPTAIEVPTTAIEVPTIAVEVPHVQPSIPSKAFTPPTAPPNNASTLPPCPNYPQIPKRPSVNPETLGLTARYRQIPNGPNVNPGFAPKYPKVPNGSNVGTTGVAPKYPPVPNGSNVNLGQLGFVPKYPQIPNGSNVNPGPLGFAPKYPQIPNGSNVNPGNVGFAPKYPQIPNGPNMHPGTPVFAPRYPQVPNGSNINPLGTPKVNHFVPPRPPAPSFPQMPPPPPPPVMESLLELRRLSGVQGTPNGIHPETPGQYNNFAVPQAVQNLRDAEHFVRCHGNGGFVSVHGGQQEGRSPTKASSPESLDRASSLDLRLDDGTVLQATPRMLEMLPRGQIVYDRAAHALVCVVDEHRSVRRLPKEVSFVDVEMHGDVDIYLREFRDVFKFAPAIFAEYFKSVTWYQIYKRTNPVTFQMFTHLHNEKRLHHFYNRHVKKLHECLSHCCVTPENRAPLAPYESGCSTLLHALGSRKCSKKNN